MIKGINKTESEIGGISYRFLTEKYSSNINSMNRLFISPVMLPVITRSRGTDLEMSSS